MSKQSAADENDSEDIDMRLLQRQSHPRKLNNFDQMLQETGGHGSF